MMMMMRATTTTTTTHRPSVFHRNAVFSGGGSVGISYFEAGSCSFSEKKTATKTRSLLITASQKALKKQKRGASLVQNAATYGEEPPAFREKNKGGGRGGRGGRGAREFFVFFRFSSLVRYLFVCVRAFPQGTAARKPRFSTFFSSLTVTKNFLNASRQAAAAEAAGDKRRAAVVAVAVEAEVEVEVEACASLRTANRISDPRWSIRKTKRFRACTTKNREEEEEEVRRNITTI